MTASALAEAWGDETMVLIKLEKARETPPLRDLGPLGRSLMVQAAVSLAEHQRKENAQSVERRTATPGERRPYESRISA